MVAGDGKLLDELKNQANCLGVEAYFIGSKSQNEVAKLYKSCDIFALPSLSDPNPLTCIEALWSKKPLLVSNHVGNYPEVINQGENGYMFSYDSPLEAISIIDNITSKDSQWLKEAGEKSYNIALELYDSYKAVQRIRKELNKCKEI